MPVPELTLEALENAVLDKCDCFARLGVWAKTEDLNFRGWLRNFTTDEERLYALHLLNSFSFYNRELCSALFYGTLQELSVDAEDKKNELDAISAWKYELNRMVFVPVEGENPNITDSGNMLANVLRKSLGIQQSQIKRLDELLSSLLNSTETSNYVIFFDDIVGSGQQFLYMLHTPRFGRQPIEIFREKGIKVVYTCLVATQHGLNNIRDGMDICTNGRPRHLPGVHDILIKPGHLISGKPYVLEHKGKIWPESLHQGLETFFTNTWQRSGAHLHFDNPYGFHELGLNIAFEHTMPDSALPIFYVTGTDWVPLMERR